MLRISSYIKLTLLVIYCSYGNVSGEQITAKSITNENFQLVLSQAGLGTFVMFSAPWCGHCKRMLPIWSELSSTHNAQSKFTIAKVDCTIDTELCSKEDILGYPTFVFYKKGDSIGQRYTNEDLSYEGFELFMFNQIYKGVNNNNLIAQQFHSLTADNFETFISEGFHFVKFFAPWCGHCKQMEKIWKDLVGVNEKVVISEVDCTIHSPVCWKYEVNGYPTILFFHNGQLVEQFKYERKSDLFKVYMDEMVSKLEEAIEKLENAGIKEEEREATPVKDNSLNLVMDLTTENQQAVFSNPGLLFVKFFAPWCGHCKKMEQTWKDLANKYANVDKLIIAEVDCTKFEAICQQNNVRGYPTLSLFNNGKHIEKYNGNRDLNSFSDFLTPHLVKYHEDL